MPSRYQPESLQRLAEAAVVLGLTSACRRVHELHARRDDGGGRCPAAAAAQSATIAFVRDRVRPHWDAAVPAPVRRRLLRRCEEELQLLAGTRDGGRWVNDADNAVPLCLLNAMLNADVRRLRVRLCGCSYGCGRQNAVLRLLAGEAAGLESLELVSPAPLTLNIQLFQSALLSMPNLKRLILKNIACDKTLKTISQSCTQLEILDVSHSSQVTDEGIKQLLLRVEIKDKLNVHNRQKGRSLMSWWQTVKTITKKMKAKTIIGRNKTNDLSFLLELDQKPTKLCSTLNTLNIANTSVTSHGILIALQNIPNLKTLGEYCHIGRALELLDKYGIPSTELQLTMANTCRTTSLRLQVLCNTCTKLNRLTITEPLHSPFMLSQLPKTLTKLNLQNIPTNQKWLDGLYQFLSGPQSSVLQELFLKFQSCENSLTIDLNTCLPKLVNLETLSIEGIDSILRFNYFNTTLEKLEKIQLSKIDSPNTFQQLLKCTPNLKVFHVFTCLGLDNLNFKDLHNNDENTTSVKQNVSKHLNCMYINNFPNGNINTVKYIMDLCPEINKIGNISNWNLSQDKIKELYTWIRKNNFKLELHSNSHWFCSECFPIL